MSSSGSFHVRAERCEDVSLDQSNHPSEVVGEWERLVASPSPGDFQRKFVRYGWSVHLHIWLGEPTAGQYCLVFQKAPSVGDELDRGNGASDGDFPSGKESNVRRAMLVNVGHVIEHRKDIRRPRAGASVRRSSTTKSVVRLYALDDCNSVRMDAREFPFRHLVKDGAATLATWVNDGELDALTALSGGATSQVESEVVERGPQIVNDVADNKGPMVGWRLSDPDAERIFRAFSIYMDFDTVGLTIEVGANLALKRFEILFCPPESGLYQLPSSHDVYSGRG